MDRSEETKDLLMQCIQEAAKRFSEEDGANPAALQAIADTARVVAVFEEMQRRDVPFPMLDD